MPYTDLSWRLFRPQEGFYDSEIQAPTRQPVRTFLPTGYEPNYAYPLLVGPSGASALALYVEDHEMAVQTLSSQGFTIFTENDLSEEQ